MPLGIVLLNQSSVIIRHFPALPHSSGKVQRCGVRTHSSTKVGIRKNVTNIYSIVECNSGLTKLAARRE